MENPSPRRITHRKQRTLNALTLSRSREDKLTHKIRVADNPLEFYDDRGDASAVIKGEKLLEIASGVPQNDDVLNPTYNTDW